MNYSLHTGSLASLEVGVLAVPVYEEALNEAWALSELDEALGGQVARIAAEEDFKGAAEKSLLVHAGPGVQAGRIVLVGLGPRDGFSPVLARALTLHATRAAQGCRAARVGVALPEVPDALRARTLEAMGEGTRLGAYRYEGHKSEAKPSPVEELVLAVPGAAAAGAEEWALPPLRRGDTLGRCTNQARDLVNGPASEVTPTRLVEFSRELADRCGLSLTVLDRDACAERKMGLFLAVAQGSEEPPRFIHLVYEPKGEPVRTVALIGKSVTFDSGGLSLKSPKHMEDMKCDMAGGAAVLAAMEAIAQAAPPVRVHALCAATENMPSGRAYRPGDVFSGMGGRSVEVLNTDAEGRLTLADAIAYAVELGVDEILELSTLTGACVVGLGSYTVGLMSMDDALAARVLSAAGEAGEDFWRLPLVERIADDLKSEVADTRNIGGSWGGAISAGLFLREFAGEVPFAHCDIAGPSWAEKPWGPHPKGGTGVGVATLVQYVTRTLAE